MRLEYRILWVDDQIEDYIEMGIKDELVAYLDGLAFKPEIDCFETAELAEEKLRSQEYDLILSDYNIDGSKSGKELIDHIREGAIFTEVLFYSAKPDFDEVAKNLYQDRVSYLSLINDDGFRNFRGKVIWLIDLTIKKLQELNSIRGLVMAETSSLDNEIIDILTAFFTEDSENSAVLREYVIKTIVTSSKGNTKKVEKLPKMSNAEILQERIFDSDKKARSLNKLVSLLKIEDDSLKEFYTNYKQDVLEVRNDLAHAKSDIIDGIECLILSRKEGDQHVKIGQDECQAIRKNLLRYSDILQKIRQEVIKQ